MNEAVSDTKRPLARLLMNMRIAKLMGLRVQLDIEDDDSREVPTWYLSVVAPSRAYGTMPVSGELFQEHTLDALAMGLESAITAYRELVQGEKRDG